MKKTSALIALLLSALMLASCGNNEKPAAVQDTPAASQAPETTADTPAPTETEAPAPKPEAAKKDDGTMYGDLSKGMPTDFEASNGWCNGNPFNVTWRKNNVTFENGKMQLIIDNDEIPKDGIPYSGGEFRSKDFYGYGRYEVSMKAIKNDGVVSSFFTYTGPSDGNPWDEIDVEILGKDTTKVQFNYYKNGRGGHEFMYDLGFDSSEDFHTYAFEWDKHSIRWFVDGEEVHSVEGEEVTDPKPDDKFQVDKKIPETPSKIMMNAWCGTGVDGWLKAFTDNALPLTAEYEWLSFTPFDE